MATVNLGLIKFRWQGAYAGGTAYVKDDVVSYNGSSYVCILASTGNLPTDTTYWNVMAQGGTDITSLAGLTQGDILYYNGTDWVRLGAGTSGQLLQTNGTGANPSWTTFSSDYVKITTATVSSAVATFNVDNVFSASDGYDSYEVILHLFPSSTPSEIKMRFIDSAGNLKNGNDYIWGLFGQEANQSSSTNAGQLGAAAGVNYMRIGGQGGNVSNSSTHGGHRAVMQIIDPTIAGYTVQQVQYTNMREPLDNIMNLMGGGVLQTSHVVRGMEFSFGSGNIASGQVSVYGRKA